MFSPLLNTKFHPSPVNPRAIQRPHLHHYLNQGLECQLTLVSAPAGFGKTTLVSNWYKGLGCPTAWLSLDRDENEPYRFFDYVTTALQQVDERIGNTVKNALRSMSPPPLEALLTILINDGAAVSTPFVLVLDDLHLIDNTTIHDALCFLLDHQPSNMHLVIATRIDPPFPLARIRAKGQIIEIRGCDLRFTLQESELLLNKVLGLGLSSEEVRLLDTRTEGWPAGLQLASLALHHPGDRSAHIQSFAGDDRHIIDYLASEVLSHQSEEIQSFLINTSILECLCDSLCDAVMVSDNSQTILEYLEEANLFIVPMDHRRKWYRYHHLFSDLLQHYLQNKGEDFIAALHRRAGDWYHSEGFRAEAIWHVLAAGDHHRAAELIEKDVLAMIDHGELTSLSNWLNRLPDDLVRSRPWLVIAQGWILLHTGQLDAAEQRAQAAEKQASTPHLVGHCAVIQAYVALAKEQVGQAGQLAEAAIKNLPETDRAARGFAMALLSSAYRIGGDLVRAALSIRDAIAINEADENNHMAVLAGCNLASLLFEQGQLHEAAAEYRRVLQIADRLSIDQQHRPPFAGIAYTGLATILREWNDLDTAYELAQEGLRLSTLWGQAEFLMHGYTEIAYLLQAMGDDKQAETALRRAQDIAQTLSPWLAAYPASLEIQIALEQNNPAAVNRIIHTYGLSISDEITYQNERLYRMWVRVLIANQEWTEALALSERLLEVLEAAGAVTYSIELLLLQAAAYQAQEMSTEALTLLNEALSLAEPEGYVRTFVEMGKPVASLLYQAAEQGNAYAGKLLASFTKEAAPQPDDDMIDPLSERELEVLALVAKGLSNQEIASHLTLSLHTIKSHTRSIYSKLGVKSRTQATVQAKALGILPD